MLLSGQKNFSRNPLIGSRLLNRWGLHTGRKRLAAALTAIRRTALRRSLRPELAEQFNRQGYIRIDDFLSAADLAAIRQELLANAWNFLEMRQASATTLRANLDVNLCRQRHPALRRLLASRELRSCLCYAAGYSGEPFIALQIIRSDGVGAARDPQSDWHADTFHSTAKAWLFLHDVAEDQGPFAYVSGSHRLSEPRLSWERERSQEAAADPNVYHRRGSFRVSEEDLARMGYCSRQTLAVPANTLIVGDTSGFHRRTPSARSTVRIEIYASLRRNPFLAGLVPHAMALPWLRDHWAGLSLRYYGLRARSSKGSAWVPCAPRALNPDEAAKLLAQSDRAGLRQSGSPGLPDAPAR